MDMRWVTTDAGVVTTYASNPWVWMIVLPFRLRTPAFMYVVTRDHMA